MKWVYGVARAFLHTLLTPKKYGFGSAGWQIIKRTKMKNVS